MTTILSASPLPLIRLTVDTCHARSKGTNFIHGGQCTGSWAGARSSRGRKSGDTNISCRSKHDAVSSSERKPATANTQIEYVQRVYSRPTAEGSNGSVAVRSDGARDAPKQPAIHPPHSRSLRRLIRDMDGCFDGARLEVSRSHSCHVRHEPAVCP